MATTEARVLSGIVHTIDRRPKDKIRVTLDLDVPAVIEINDRVTITRALSDEDAGRRLREILTGADIDPLGVSDLIEAIRDSDGWPVLAELIGEITGLPA